MRQTKLSNQSWSLRLGYICSLYAVLEDGHAAEVCLFEVVASQRIGEAAAVGTRSALDVKVALDRVHDG